MTTTLYASFPVLFSILGLFYGWIAFSILFRKKPVIVSSNLVALLVTVTYIPIILLLVLQFNGESRLGLWQLLSPVAFAFLLVFLVFVLRGFSVYGFGSDDFRRTLLAALAKLNVRVEEELGKIRLPDLETELNVAFQERLGTGMVKCKNRQKFDVRDLRKALQAVVKEQDVQVKRLTAYFYIGFGVLMLTFSSFFVWTLVEKLV